MDTIERIRKLAIKRGLTLGALLDANARETTRRTVRKAAWQQARRAS